MERLKNAPCVKEINQQEQVCISGGGWTDILLGELIGLLLSEWDATKRAARDAWNLTYKQ